MYIHIHSGFPLLNTGLKRILLIRNLNFMYMEIHAEVVLFLFSILENRVGDTGMF